jgi:hypothetical protein
VPLEGETRWAVERLLDQPTGCKFAFPRHNKTDTTNANQIVSEPRRFSASLEVRPFLILQVGGDGLLRPSSYHAGIKR